MLSEAVHRHHSLRVAVLGIGAAILLPLATFGQRPQLPTAATDAVVRAEEVAVFAEMDASSDKTSTLKKGASIYVDLRMDQNGKSWCGVRPSANSNRIGFVDCRLLERVEKAAPTGTPGAGGAASATSRAAPEMPVLRPATPTASGYAAIKEQVIKEGVIDSGFIATLEGQAASGNSAAVTRAALGHLAAGEFELSQHEPDKALQHFEALQRFAGSQRNLLQASLEGRAYALSAKSEFGAALEIIEQARKIAPQSVRMASLSGWAHYRMNQMDAAIADLQQAQRLQPNANVAALLAQAQRDKEAEDDFAEGESRHFVLRYHEGASRQLASELIHTLEEHFQSLQAELHYTPAEPIAVIVYTREKFRDVTGAPDWAGALNDGRIRVAAQGLETIPDALSRSLKHELTHSFLYQKTQGRCPTWVQEGVAQWMAGRRVGSDADRLLAAFQSGQGKKLRGLETNWTKFSSPEAWYAYQWSLATIEGIEADSGGDGIVRLIDAMRTEASGEDALRLALRTNYSSLDESTVEYLRRTYLQ